MDMQARETHLRRRAYYVREKKRTLEYLESMLQDSKKKDHALIDLCCGTGRITGILTNLPNVSIVHAVDINPASLDALQKNLSAQQRTKISTTEADVTQPLHLPRTDIVICLESLVHLEHLSQVVENIATCLTGGGIFIGNCIPRERTLVWRKTIYGPLALPVHAIDLMAKKLSRVTFLRQPLDSLGLLRSQKISRSDLCALIAQKGFTIIRAVDTEDSFWFAAQKN